MPAFGGSTRDLTLEDCDAVARQSPAVREVAPFSLGAGAIEYAERSRDVRVIGTTAPFLEVRKLTIAAGRFLPPGDPRQGDRVVVLGQKVARELFQGENPLGRLVRIALLCTGVALVICGLFVYFFIPLTLEQFRFLQTTAPSVIVLMHGAWYLLLRWQLAPVRAFLARPEAAVARWAASSSKTNGVTVVAVGPRASTVALVAGALEQEAITGLQLHEPLASLKEVIAQNRIFAQMPEMFCFGLLEVCDIPQLKALLAPRPVQVGL
jgi:hypothetical protein